MMFARNVGIPLDLQTRAMEDGGAIPHPPVRRKTGILFGFCLRRNREGINIALRILGWERIRYIWKFSQPPPVKAPQEECPSVLTEMPTGRVYDVEDIRSGELEPVELIEPKDM